MLRSPWGPHAVFVYLCKHKPHVEGTQDLEGAAQQTCWPAPASLWNSPHPWVRERLLGAVFITKVGRDCAMLCGTL